jgi:hypothetical protein
MAGAALGSFSFAGHLFWIHVLLMRETLDPELAHLRRKTDPCSLRVNRRFVADDAHLTRRVAEVFRVTLYARRMTREYRCCAIVGALMTKRAVLCLGLVLDAGVIEG